MPSCQRFRIEMGALCPLDAFGRTRHQARMERVRRQRESLFRRRKELVTDAHTLTHQIQKTWADIQGLMEHRFRIHHRDWRVRGT